MDEWLGSTAYSGSLLLAVPIAALAGLLSFFSPCVVPLLPGYLSYVTGLSTLELETARRGRMLAGTVLFVLGFSAFYVSLGAFFGAVGFRLLEHQRTLTIGLGVVTIMLGLAFMGLVPFARRELRVRAVPAVGVGAAPVLGVVFALGWTPCIGPTLAAALTLSAREASAPRAAFLTFIYCLGLGIPFVVAGLAFRRTLRAVAWVRGHQLLFTRIGGGLLVAVGVLLLTGWWDLLVSDLRQWAAGFTAVI